MNASLIRYYEHDRARLRLGRDLGPDPAAMTSGATVKGDVDLVETVVAGHNPLDQRVVWPVHRGGDVAFDPVEVITAFHSSQDAVRVRAAHDSHGLTYVLTEQPPARTI